MYRRLTSLLVVWFGLLSVVAPAITCAAAIQQGNCCPSKGPAPCGECPDKRAAIPAPSHCAVSPVQAVATAAVSQTAAEHGVFPDAPDVIAVFDLPPLVAPVRVELASRPDTAARLASDAAFTYLVTGRLRL
jgi:hypothetical protein